MPNQDPAESSHGSTSPAVDLGVRDVREEEETPNDTDTGNHDDDDDDDDDEGTKDYSALEADAPPLSSSDEISAPPLSASEHSEPDSPSPPPSPPPPPPPPPTRLFRRRPPLPPPKSILKPPSLSRSTFSFRRDILQPFNTLASSYTSSSAATGAGKPTVVLGNTVDAIKHAAPVVAVGNFWGGAMKRLVAGVGGAPAGKGVLRDLGQPQVDNASTSTQIQGQGQGELGAVGGGNGSAESLPQSGRMLSVSELKKVRFRMGPLLKVVYPINGPNGPLAPWEEGRTKKRINDEYRALQRKSIEEGGDARGWTGEKLGRLYAECCKAREEKGIERVKKALENNPDTPPRIFDLSHEELSKGAVEALADLLSVDFGLKKVVLEECGLNDESLKPLLHSLLVSGNVPTLSLANNKRIKNKGWKLVAIFTRKAHFLRYLDISENNLDKRAAEFLVQAISASPSSSSSTKELAPSSSQAALPSSDSFPLLAEDPSTDSNPSVSIPIPTPLLPPSSSESEQHESLEAEQAPFYDASDDGQFGPLFTVAPLLLEDSDSKPGSVLSLRIENCGLKPAALDALAHGIRASNLKHISIRRNRISPIGAVALAIMIRDYPIASDPALLSSPTPTRTPSFPSTLPLPPTSPLPSHSHSFAESSNSVTARQALQAPYVRRNNLTPSPPPRHPSVPSSRSASPTVTPTLPTPQPREGGGEANFHGKLAVAAAVAQAEKEAWQNSEARNRLKKQIEELPRTGSLLTLDVKGNDIRNGVVYISQVLKRNRTLKVLNLSDNKLDAQGLISIAEALKYNSTLETLDLSFNPCCGGGLEGITALRIAITINTSLKRLFLNGTNLTSDGAIALAEFLPMTTSLIHLDLTDNDVEIAGVMALSASLKINSVLRCLDLNIPPNDPDFARLSQEILQCCVRNTEKAQDESTARGHPTKISIPILKSAVARDLKSRQEAEQRKISLAQSKDAILVAAEECKIVLEEILATEEQNAIGGETVVPDEIVQDLLVQAQLAEAQLAEAFSTARSGDVQKHRAVTLGDDLSAILDRAKRLYDAPVLPVVEETPVSSLQPNGQPSLQVSTSDHPAPPSPNAPPVSPSFSITNSSDEEDEDDNVPLATLTFATTPLESSTSPSLPSTSNGSASTTTSPPDSPRSPISDLSRRQKWEEGEVFRKGTVLGTADVADEEDSELAQVSGEELKKEILETEVRRNPTRVVIVPPEALEGESVEGGSRGDGEEP